MVADGFSRCLEITKRVLFWRLIASPEDDIHATILLTSIICSCALSLEEVSLQ